MSVVTIWRISTVTMKSPCMIGRFQLELQKKAATPLVAKEPVISKLSFLCFDFQKKRMLPGSWLPFPSREGAALVAYMHRQGFVLCRWLEAGIKVGKTSQSFQHRNDRMSSLFWHHLTPEKAGWQPHWSTPRSLCHVAPLTICSNKGETSARTSSKHLSACQRWRT